MRLTQVRIVNFRSISSTTITLEPRCRVLVGINESGKSNILRALSLLDKNRNPSPDDLRNFPPDEDPNQRAYVHFVFSFERAERVEHYEYARDLILATTASPSVIEHDGKQLTLAQFVDSRTEGIYIVDIRTGKKNAAGWKLPAGYSLAGEWKIPSASCPADLQIVKADGSAVKANEFELIQAAFTKDLPAEYFKDATADDVNDLAIGPITARIDDELPGCLYWSYSDSHLLPGQISLDAFAANPSSCEPLRHMFALADISDVPAEIAAARVRTNGIRNLLNRVADRATKHMKSVWKDYRGITIELAPNGSNIDANIKDEHNLYDFARRSDGFKRFITFLLMVSAKQRADELRNTLYLHDEPDVSLHPSGARYLRDELIKISENNYVVFSTHSIFMIDRVLLRRHLIVAKRKEITEVREADESNIVDEEVIYNALGYSIFENLKKQNIIFEGWRDKRVFEVAMRAVPAKFKQLKSAFSDIGICHARGVKDIGRITPMLELAGRDWLVLSDGDKAASEQQARYDGKGPWFRYDELLTGAICVTGEDFLKAEAFVSPLNKVRSEHPTLPVFDISNLAAKDGKLAAIKGWLQGNGVSGEKTKEILEGLKEKLFEGLKPSHIEEKYFDLLSELANKIGT